MIKTAIVQAATGAVAVNSAVRVTESLSKAPDPLIWGLLPATLFYASLFGASIGVFLMHRKLAEEISIPPDPSPWVRLLSVIIKIGLLGGTVLAFAGLTTGLLGAWIAHEQGGDVTTTTFWAMVAIVAGSFVGALIPRIQAGLEGTVDDAFARIRSIIGSKE